MDKEPNNDARRLTAGAGSIKEAIEPMEQFRDNIVSIDGVFGIAAGLALSSSNAQGLGTSAGSGLRTFSSRAAGADLTPNMTTIESIETSDF